MLDDGESQARTAHLTRPGFINPVEPLENPRQISGGYANAGVSHDDADVVAGFSSDLHTNFARGTIELDGVVKQVHQSLFKAPSFCKHFGFIQLAACKGNPAKLGRWPDHFQSRINSRAHGNRP